MATISQLRVRNLYDLMDSAYDAKQIHEHSKGLGHVPIIDHIPQRKGKAALIREKTAQRAAGLVLPEDVRYRERSTVERAFGRLKDEFGGRICPRAWAQEGDMPLDVRCAGTDGRSAVAYGAIETGIQT